jgi:hypothetical protein
MPTLAELLAKKSPAPPTASSGIKITPESDKAVLAATIKATFDATAPKIQPPAPEERELGAMEPGDRIPMDHATDPQGKAWFTACHSYESSLCVILEPAPSPHAWLAVTTPAHPSPILLHRLPLANYSTNANPF